MVVVSKFSHGAWITAIVIPGFVLVFRWMRRYQERLSAATHTDGPLDLSGLNPPIVVIPLRRLDHVAQKALRFAVTISPRVFVVQVLAEELDTDDLQARWRERVERPARERELPVPELLLLRSQYRQFFERFLGWLDGLIARHPGGQVIVLIPELVQRRWFDVLVRHRAARLKAHLLRYAAPQVAVMSTPWHLDEVPARGAVPERGTRLA